MATISEKINQGLTNLYTSPLGMASLGLLMQPSMSKEPINPWQYAAEGMQLGIQNRAQQQQLQEEQARQAENDQMRRARYLMDIQRFQNERIQQEQAAVEAERQRAAMRQFRDSLSPEEARLFDVLGPGYAKQMMAQRQPKLTSLVENLIAAGFQPDTPEFQAEMRQILRSPKIQIGPTEKPLSVSDVTKLRDPSGKPIPYGVTPEQAQQMGATPVDLIQQAQEMQKVKEEAERRAKAPAIQSFNMLADEMVGTEKNPGVIDRVTTGGPLGAYGFLSRGLDPSDVQNFESIVSTMSTQLRSILRIPGEGTLTDQEQRQYGLTLPSISNSPDVNKAIINRLKAILKTRGGIPATSIQDQADAILRGEM